MPSCLQAVGELADGGGLSHAVDADHQDHRRAGWRVSMAVSSSTASAGPGCSAGPPSAAPDPSEAVAEHAVAGASARRRTAISTPMSARMRRSSSSSKKSSSTSVHAAEHAAGDVFQLVENPIVRVPSSAQARASSMVSLAVGAGGPGLIGILHAPCHSGGSGR